MLILERSDYHVQSRPQCFGAVGEGGQVNGKWSNHRWSQRGHVGCLGANLADFISVVSCLYWDGMLGLRCFILLIIVSCFTYVSDGLYTHSIKKWLLACICSGLIRRCYVCRSRGPLGDCGDPFNDTLAKVSLGVQLDPCSSGWCGKIISDDNGLNGNSTLMWWNFLIWFNLQRLTPLLKGCVSKGLQMIMRIDVQTLCSTERECICVFALVICVMLAI